MSDDLVKRLRDPEFGTETTERNLMNSAADRIEELEAALPEQIEWVKRLADDLNSAEGREARLEAKLAKAVEALEGVRAFVRDLAPYADQGHTLVPALEKACTTLAELTGGKDD